MNITRLVHGIIPGLVALWAAWPAFPAYAETGNDCLATHWPHEVSSLAPDSSLYFGRLENGFRYVLKRNAEPRDRVGVYLNVEAGSVFEQESERGIAHFLEHLLFSGTTHFNPGELIEYFQSIGMSFGADVNAATGYTDTVYKLILPEGSVESIDKALLVMSDYAGGALLLAEEIDRERGIILAEKTARDSAAYRSHIARTAFVFDNTIIPDRRPIGTETVIKNADRDVFAAFYERWYRPDNMVLVMVGDFVKEEVEPLIEGHFSSMSADSDGTCPEYGAVEHRGVKSFYRFEPETGATDVYIETVQNKIPENDSIEVQRRELHRYIAAMIVNHRLQRLQEVPDTPFVSARYYDTTMFDRFRLAGISARTDKDGWETTLAAIDRALRQVLQYGIFKNELERVKKQLLTDLENRVLVKDTRNSLGIIDEILANLNGNRVLLSPEQERELHRRILEQTTVDDIDQFLKNAWSVENRLVQVIGDAELTVDGQSNELKTLYTGLSERGIEPPVKHEKRAFPYLEFPQEPVEPMQVTAYPDIGVQRLDYKNGFVLNLKKTDFKKNQISAALHFGNGRAAVPAAGLETLSAAVINGSGTAVMTEAQLDEALSGTSVNARFRIGEESFSFAGTSVSSEAELLFQLLFTLFTDPGFRKDEYQAVMKRFKSMYQRMEQDINGARRMHLESFFTGNARGSGLPAWDEFNALQLDDITAWLVPYFSNGPLELSVVGDFDAAEIAALAGKYFGGIPAAGAVPVPELEAVFPAGQQYEITIESSIDKALVTVGWLTDDAEDRSRARRLHVLAAVFEERVREKLREELGTVYSPRVYSTVSRVYPGYGMIRAEVVVDRASVGIAAATLGDIADSLSSDPVKPEEVERARKPIVTSLKDQVRTNGYWLYSVLSLSSRHPLQLEWAKTMLEEFAAVGCAQIDELARAYLIEERMARAIVTPAGGAGM